MKKSIGLVKAVDPVGRMVIPSEIRRVFNINPGDSLELFTEGDNIILKKYTPGCHCCNDRNNLREILGLKLCDKCIESFEKARKEIDDLR